MVIHWALKELMFQVTEPAQSSDLGTRTHKTTPLASTDVLSLHHHRQFMAENTTTRRVQTTPPMVAGPTELHSRDLCTIILRNIQPVYRRVPQRWGVPLDDQVTSGLWLSEGRTFHVCVLELKPMINTIHHYRHALHQASLMVVTDKVTVVADIYCLGGIHSFTLLQVMIQKSSSGCVEDCGYWP